MVASNIVKLRTASKAQADARAKAESRSHGTAAVFLSSTPAVDTAGNPVAVYAVACLAEYPSGAYVYRKGSFAAQVAPVYPGAGTRKAGVPTLGEYVGDQSLDMDWKAPEHKAQGSPYISLTNKLVERLILDDIRQFRTLDGYTGKQNADRKRSQERIKAERAAYLSERLERDSTDRRGGMHPKLRAHLETELKQALRAEVAVGLTFKESGAKAWAYKMVAEGRCLWATILRTRTQGYFVGLDQSFNGEDSSYIVGVYRRRDEGDRSVIEWEQRASVLQNLPAFKVSLFDQSTGENVEVTRRAIKAERAEAAALKANPTCELLAGMTECIDADALSCDEVEFSAWEKRHESPVDMEDWGAFEDFSDFEETILPFTAAQ